MHFQERAVTKTLGASVYLRLVCETNFTWLHQAHGRAEILGFRHVVKSKKPRPLFGPQCTLRRQVYAEKYCHGWSPRSHGRRSARPRGAIRILNTARLLSQCTPQVRTHLRVHVLCGSRASQHTKKMHWRTLMPKHALHQQNMASRRVNWSRWFCEWTLSRLRGNGPTFLFAMRVWFVPPRGHSQILCALVNGLGAHQHSMRRCVQHKATSCSVRDSFWNAFLWGWVISKYEWLFASGRA